MTIRRIATCDAPHCNREYALQDKLDREVIPVESGWFTVVFGAAAWHFCSFACLSKWSERKAGEEESMKTNKGPQVGTSQHHGTKLPPF